MAQLQGGGGGGGGKNHLLPSVTAPITAPPVRAGITGITAVPKTRAAGMGYSGGRGVGGGTGSNSSGYIGNLAAPVQTSPPPMSLDDFVSQDTAYQSQLAALSKAFTDYQSQQEQAKTNYLTNYGTDRDALERNRVNAMSELENDFASRGLLQSGLYADSRADLTNDYDRRNAALEQAKAQYIAGLTNDLSNFQSEQDLTKQRALQEAAARRAAQYGI